MTFFNQLIVMTDLWEASSSTQQPGWNIQASSPKHCPPMLVSAYKACYNIKAVF